MFSKNISLSTSGVNHFKTMTDKGINSKFYLKTNMFARLKFPLIQFNINLSTKGVLSQQTCNTQWAKTWSKAENNARAKAIWPLLQRYFDDFEKAFVRWVDWFLQYEETNLLQSH